MASTEAREKESITEISIRIASCANNRRKMLRI